ncbi:hypothetical protein ACQP0C_41700 (plasmid) [Nocardia sp. CA-129566]|uniref:hypothetical protein n=1 Tax=Nocardia sp. CA-129566 TaxID=3239976 RepID=UPI003D99A448
MTTTAIPEWQERLRADLARIQAFAAQFTAAAATGDLTIEQLHAAQDRMDVIRAEWEHAPSVAARRMWARLESGGGAR